MTAAFRLVVADDLPALLALNNAHATETGPLDAARLGHLTATAFRACTDAGGTALLIAFDQAAAYDSANFLWFRDRYPRFVYIDRVMVAAHARGKGVARAMYADLFAAAREAGHTIIACEVNRVPPNPGSDAFHAALGFAEAGRGSPSPGKQVRYLTRMVAVS